LALREKTNGKFRLLHNLSYPHDITAVNFNIPEYSSTVKYNSISSAVKIIQKYNKPYLAKTDIAEAFRIIPVHPSCYHLLGFQSQKKYYYDRCLPQGCSSSCQIFESFSDSIIWMLDTHYGINNVVKVLDDFLFIGETEEHANEMIEQFFELTNKLNVPIAHHKTEGPATKLTFLGIELDTINMTAKLPTEKIIKYRNQIDYVLEKDVVTLKELQSTIGMLQFSTSVIPVGKCFLRRLYTSTIGIRIPYYNIKITNSMKEDLRMWKDFIDNYNGISFINYKPQVSSYDIHMYSDSSKKGFGATYGKEYITGIFPESWQDESIELLELYPIFLLVLIFKNSLSHKRVMFHCDNTAVVQILNKQSSKAYRIMNLLRPMILTMLNYNISFCAVHIPGTTNIICDTLSRKQVDRKFLRDHGMNMYPTPIPMALRPQNLRMT